MTLLLYIPDLPVVHVLRLKVVLFHAPQKPHAGSYVSLAAIGIKECAIDPFGGFQPDKAWVIGLAWHGVMILQA